MNYLQQFRVLPGAKVKLKEIDPAYKDHHQSREQAAEGMAFYQKRLRELQELLYVERRRSLLICLQAMDTGGKDGTINHVLSGDESAGLPRGGFSPAFGRRAGPRFSVARAPGRAGLEERSLSLTVPTTKTCSLSGCTTWFPRRFGRGATSGSTISRRAWSSTTPTFSSSTSTSPKTSSFHASRTGWTTRPSNGRSARLTIKSAIIGTSTRPRMRTPCRDAARNTRLGSSFRPNHKWFRNLAVARIITEHLEGLKMTYPKPAVDMEHIRREYHAAEKA